jgi:hypothetical protein
MYHLNHNQDIIELLEKLRGFQAGYPARLFFARRVSFISLVNRYIIALL